MEWKEVLKPVLRAPGDYPNDTVSLSPDMQVYEARLCSIRVRPVRYLLTNFSDVGSRLDQAEAVMTQYVDGKLDKIITDKDIHLGLMNPEKVKELGRLPLRQIRADSPVLGARILEK